MVSKYSFIIMFYYQLPDKGVFWQVDYQRFNHYLRDQHIINAIGERVDKVSSVRIWC